MGHKKILDSDLFLVIAPATSESQRKKQLEEELVDASWKDQKDH